MWHGTVTKDRRGCCKPAWLSGTTPLFQIPRPVEENGNSFSSPENVTPCWLPASCCYGCVFFTVFTQVSLCYPEKQANHPAVNKAMVARHQATGRGDLEAERLAFLRGWMNSAGYHSSSQGKKVCSEATGREFLAAFFTLWAVFWDELDFHLETQLCGPLLWFCNEQASLPFFSARIEDTVVFENSLPSGLQEARWVFCIFPS